MKIFVFLFRFSFFLIYEKFELKFFLFFFLGLGIVLVLVLVFELYVFLVKFEELICNLVVVICFGLFFVWFGFIDIYEFVKTRFSLLGRSGSGRRVFFLVYCGIG